MTRHFLRRICRVLIGAVLFAQMAVSAYACPGLLPGTTMDMPMFSATAVDGAVTTLADVADVQATAPQATDCAGMAGPMDPAFANLCAEHCRYGQHSDQAATLSVPAVLLTALYTTPLVPETGLAPRPAAAATCALAAAFPPLAILHCCFRI